jgi:hypothetical protein
MNKIFKIRIAGMFIALAMVTVFGVGVMLLWNALLPGIFGLPFINYWQAVGVLLLTRVLFGGFGGGRFMPRDWPGRDEHLFRQGNPLREKWLNMTDEERRAFIAKEKDFMRFHQGFSHFHDFFDGDGKKSNGKDAPGNKGKNNE